jgi:hypothetical protein
MAMSVEVTDSGTMIQTELTMEEIRRNIEMEVASQLDIIWIQILGAAVELCPKETGALASSIRLESESGYARGAIGVAGIAGEEFYSNSIYAGRFDVINPVTGEPTDLYALFVHDGHALPNGGFYEGVPFLAEAVEEYQSELDACVDRAMTENNWNTQE